MRRLKAALLSAALLVGGAAAQSGYGPVVTTTYDLRTLTERPGIIHVSPRYITVIEFSDLIDEVGTSQPSLLQIRVSDSENIIFLKALRQAGNADLVVRVGGYVALFRIVVDARMESPRRYIVTLPVRGGHALPVQPGPARPSEAPQSDTSLPSGGQAGGLRGQVSQQTEPPTNDALPSWLSARFTPSISGNSWMIYYEVQNSGNAPITLRARDLVVRRGAVPIPFRIVRTAFGEDPEEIKPGQTASGVIVAEGAQEPITWEWRVNTAQTTYTLRGTAR